MSVKQITSKKLILDAFEGKLNERYPIWFMRQAGRYLPEYMDIRETMSFEERVQNPNVAKTITLQPIERFDLDAAIIFSDILVPLYHQDVGLSIIPEIGPKLTNPIKSPKDIKRLRLLDSSTDYPYLGESVGLVRDEIPDKALIGFSGAPFTIASYLIEGKSTRTALKTKQFALKYPQEFDVLMDLITDIVIDQLKSQINNGADLVQVFDSWAGFLNAEQFDDWSLPHLRRIFNEFKSIPNIFYARGSSHLLPVALNTGSKGFGVDPSITIDQASKIIGKSSLLQGNLDPAYLLSTPGIVRSKVEQILESVHLEGRSNYIFNLGIGIDRESNLDCVYTMIETVKSFERK